MNRLIDKVCTVYEDDLWFYKPEEQNIIISTWNSNINNLKSSSNYRKIYFMNPMCFNIKNTIKNNNK